MNERRGATRIKGPFEARWSGGSGSCTIADLSTTGCYVNSLAAQAIGSRVTVTLSAPGGRTLELPGVIVSVDHGIGFGVRFDGVTDDDGAALEQWIAAR